MSFKSIERILNRCEKENKDFFTIILEEDMADRHVSKDESISAMTVIYDSMHIAEDSYDSTLQSSSGLVGGDGAKMLHAIGNGQLLGGEFMSRVIATALKTGESNACMKRIVAAPTAGSCGVVPAVLLNMERQRNLPKEKIIEALYVTAGIGQVIASRASISGAEGGCQAEIGAASAMAAGGAAYLQGGDATCIAHAAAMAMKNLLGLACDPVAGLVEVPCVKRNVIGAVNAVASADMAIAGVRSQIPTDEVIDAMRTIGQNMPEDIRETGVGGLAGTPTGIKIKKSLNHY